MTEMIKKTVEEHVKRLKLGAHLDSKWMKDEIEELSRYGGSRGDKWVFSGGKINFTPTTQQLSVTVEKMAKPGAGGPLSDIQVYVWADIKTNIKDGEIEDNVELDY